MLLRQVDLLIAEDDPDARDYLRMFLEDEVGRLRVAQNGQEALKLVEDRMPDIVLTDIDMPVMDGLTLTRLIKSIHPQTQVIAVTAHDTKEVLKEAIEVGVDGFICKPVNFDLLMEKLRKTTEKIVKEKERILTEQEEHEKLIRMAHYDALTQLPNRYLFDLTLQKAISRANRDQKAVALMFIDLDDFKRINDEYGHLVGDCLLKNIADNLLRQIRRHDTLARIGGDEFALIVESVDRCEDLTTLAQKLIDALQTPIVCEDHRFQASCSIGISCYPLLAKDKQTLLHQADMAMYRAKKSGKNRFAFYENEASGI